MQQQQCIITGRVKGKKGKGVDRFAKEFFCAFIFFFIVVTNLYFSGSHEAE